MNKKEFQKLLNENGYDFKVKDNKIIINHQGYVNLRSLTTLPERVEFNNQGNVNLYNLTTLPEGVEFNNQGFVDLRSLTTLPEGVEFNNQGYVYLYNLTTLLEGVKFNNQGYVNLRSLTTLPEGVGFNNQGDVNLRSLTGKHNYRGKLLEFKHIDGYTMIIESTKKSGDFTIMKSRYFKGGEISDMPKCWIASRGDYFAHGKTMKQAIEDVNFKYLQATLDVTELVESIKKSKVVTKNDYRLLTGACSMGCDEFMKEHGIKDSVPLDDCKKLVRNAYGGERFNELFS